MCVVSYIGDSYRTSFPERWPTVYPWVYPHTPERWPSKPTIAPQKDYPFKPTEVTKQEFESLKKEVEELKKLLLAAKEYDKNTGQPDCQMDEKVEFLKKIADFVGVDLKEVFGNK